MFYFIFVIIYIIIANSGISEDQLEKESKTLDIKFNDLLKVFTEPNFLATSKLNFFKIDLT